MVNRVIYFDHSDFLITLKNEILPLFSRLGIYVLKNWENHIKTKGNKEKRRRIKITIDIIIAYLEKENVN